MKWGMFSGGDDSTFSQATIQRSYGDTGTCYEVLAVGSDPRVWGAANVGLATAVLDDTSMFILDYWHYWHYSSESLLPWPFRAIVETGPVLVLAGDSGVAAINPVPSPRLVFSARVEGVLDVQATVGRVYTLRDDGTVLVFDTIDSTGIALRDSIEDTLTGAIFVATDTVFTAGRNRVSAYASNGPGTSFHEITGLRFGGFAKGLTLHADYLYVAIMGEDAKSFNGVFTYDLRNPAMPTLVDSQSTPGNAQGLYVDGKYIYVASGDSGVSLLHNRTYLSPKRRSEARRPASGKKTTFGSCPMK
jgi:hypothetical protein